MKKVLLLVSILLFSCSNRKTINQEMINEMPQEQRSELSNRLIQDGRRNMKLMRYEIACFDFRTALMIQPKEEEILKGLSVAFAELGYFDSAITYAERNISFHGGEQTDYIFLAKMYHKKGDSQKEIDCLKKSISLNDEEPSQYFLLGKNYYDSNNPEEAIKNLQLFKRKYGTVDFNKMPERKKENLSRMNEKCSAMLKKLLAHKQE
jgi:tetratricopeptide (TPR) repeat protein